MYTALKIHSEYWTVKLQGIDSPPIKYQECGTLDLARELADELNGGAATCKGSKQLGTACGMCVRCQLGLHGRSAPNDFKVATEEQNRIIGVASAELRKIRNICPHENLVTVNKSDTGNWCEYDDSYWSEHTCSDCGANWGSNQRDKTKDVKWKNF